MFKNEKFSFPDKCEIGALIEFFRFWCLKWIKLTGQNMLPYQTLKNQIIFFALNYITLCFVSNWPSNSFNFLFKSAPLCMVSATLRNVYFYLTAVAECWDINTLRHFISILENWYKFKLLDERTWIYLERKGKTKNY